MGLQVKRLFCLLVCCELSSLLNGSPNLSCRDCEQSSSSENLLISRTRPKDLLSSRTRPEDLLSSRTRPEDSLSSRTRPEDLLGSRTRPKDLLGSRTRPEDSLSSSKHFEDLLRSITRPKNLLSSRTRPEDRLSFRTRLEDLLTPRTRPGDPLSSRTTPEDLLSSRTRTEDLLSSTTRPDQDLLAYRTSPEDLLSSTTRPEHLPQRDASYLQAQRSSSRPLLQKEPRSHPRHKRGTSTDPEPPSADLSDAQKLVETLPKPLAQNQSTFSPGDFTLDNGLFTVPEGDYQDFTPLVPLSTRPKTPGVRNPFYPLTGDSYGAYAIMFISIIIFTVGIIGNIAIMCIVCHNYYMRSISNSLLANLALWDFLIVFFCLPLVIFHELTKDWLLGEFSCKIVPYIEVASLGVTTFTLCALCIDRFRAASNVQMYYEMIENCASTAAKLAVIWIGALLLALPELLIHQLVREEREPPEVTPCERCVVRISTALPDTLYVLGLTYNGARLWWYFGCYFCLPTIFTIISSVVTAQKIRKAERVSVRGNRKQIQLESQMNCMVVALAILYGFCAIPENICNIMSVYMAAGVPRRTLDIMHLVSQMLLFCKSAVTPVLLLALCKPFGRAFLDCCCCCWDECGPPKSSTATSDDNEHECTTELELSPFSTMRRETSTYTAAGTHC